MKIKKNIAIVAHDNRKKDINEWVAFNWKELVQHNLICTGTTGKMVENTLAEKCTENSMVPPTVKRLKSGPLGGDQQLGALIVEGEGFAMISKSKKLKLRNIRKLGNCAPHEIITVLFFGSFVVFITFIIIVCLLLMYFRICALL